MKRPRGKPWGLLAHAQPALLLRPRERDDATLLGRALLPPGLHRYQLASINRIGIGIVERLVALDVLSAEHLKLSDRKARGVDETMTFLQIRDQCRAIIELG